MLYHSKTAFTGIQTRFKQEITIEDKYFKQSEIECKCGCGGLPTQHAFDMLTCIRKQYGKPIKVNSGYRCTTHNKAIGGASRSKHVDGVAFDIELQSRHDIPLVIALGYSVGFRGFGIIDFRNAIIHLDIREYDTMWEY